MFLHYKAKQYSLSGATTEVKLWTDSKRSATGSDDIDKEILALFMKRMELCKGVADYKKANNMPVFQGGREQEVIDRIKSLTADKRLENGTAALFTTIMDISKIPPEPIDTVRAARPCILRPRL